MKNLPMWGMDIRPLLPWRFKLSQWFQMWRNTIVIQELLFVKCSVCAKDFAIRRLFCQKTVVCPYCGGNTAYIGPPEKYLAKVCLEVSKQQEDFNAY